MAHFYRITAALVAVFFAFNSVSIELGNPNPSGSPSDELFDYAYGRDQNVTTARWPNCYGEVQSQNTCKSLHLAVIQDYISANSNGSFKYEIDTTFGSGGCSESETTVSWSHTCKLKLLRWNPDLVPARWVLVSSSNNQLSASLFDVEDKQCPPSDPAFIDYTITAKIGEAAYCWSAAELATRDSCPDSTSDGDFVLPAGENQSASICQVKADGSVCPYVKNGDVYVADFEGDCYGNYASATPYQPPQTYEGDPNGCKLIANTSDSFICPADPQDKCTVGGTVNGQASYSSCESGCGYMDLSGSGTSEFVCLVGPDTTDPTDPTDPEEPPEEPEEPTDPTDDSDKSITSRIDKTNYELAKANNSLSSIDNKASTTNSELKALNTELKNNSAGLGALNDKADGILTETRKISAALDGTGTTFTGEPSTNLKSFYTPEYENGFTSIWEKNEQAFDNSSAKAYIDQWDVTVSGNFNYPQFCFDLGFVNLGCHQVEIDGRILAFIRIILIISALFLARQITLGG